MKKKEYSCDVTSNHEQSPPDKYNCSEFDSFKCFQCIYQLRLLQTTTNANSPIFFSETKTFLKKESKNWKKDIKVKLLIGLVPFSNDYYWLTNYHLLFLLTNEIHMKIRSFNH